MVVIDGEAFKPAKQEAGCHDHQIDEVLNFPRNLMEILSKVF
jgi:hypothetical protein